MPTSNATFLLTVSTLSRSRRFSTPRRRCPALSGALILWTSLAPAFGEFRTPIAVTHVTLVQPDGTTVEKATILIVDGRIAAAGVNVTIPTAAETVDGDGLFAYPGFVDAHTNLGIPEKSRSREERALAEDENPDLSASFLPSMHAAGRRGIRPHHRAVELYAPDEKKLESHRAAGFTTALIAPRDGIFSGTSDVLSLGGKPVRRSILAEDVAMHASFSTGEDGEYPQTLLGVFAQFRQTLLDARWHARMLKYEERRPTAGPRVARDAALTALQPMLARTQRVIFEANTENEINRALDLCAEFNLSPVISGGREAWRVASRLKAERVPLILNLKFDEEPAYGKKKDKKKSDSREKSGERAPVEKPESTEKKSADVDPEKVVDTKPGTVGESEDPEKDKRYEPLKVQKERRRLWEEQVANALKLHEAGVPFSLRTRDFRDPAELFKNLRLVIERGLPESAALQALTTTPAELLGLKHQLGAVDAGYVANVILMDRRFTDEKAKVKKVFVDGVRFDLDRDDKKEPDKKKADRDATADEKKSKEKSEATEKQGASDDEADENWPTFESEILADRIPKTRTGGNVLIRNATILPVSSPAMENASILIENGKITAIGQVPHTPPGVTVIDGTGRFVMPGIVDCHSHLGIDGVNEGAHSISAEVRIGDLIRPRDLAIYRAVAGGATTHHAMHGSANTIGGQCVIFKLKYERPVSEMLIPTAPRTIKFALGENVKQSNFPNAWGKRYPNTRLGVEAVLRGSFEAARTYQQEWTAYENAVKSGLDVPIPRRDLKLEALADVLAGRMTVHCHCYRSDEILRLIDIAEEYGVRIGVWHHVLEGYRIAPELARHGGGASSFANMWAYKIEAFGAIPHNAAFMTDAGVCSTVNSDSANTIRYLNQEAAKCIRWGGLDEIEALKLVTLNAAKQLEIEDRVGSLEVGKDGDLAVFNGHPLNTFSKNVMTIIDGEVFFEDARPEPATKCDDLPVVATVDRTIPSTPHRAYAIVGATVHPISSPSMDNASVVIVEDRIHAIGSDVIIPPGAGVIDGKGLHVYPGLIDAGSVLGLNEIDSLRASKDTTELGAFNPHLIASNAVHPHSEHIRVARTTGITTTLVKPSGGRIAGQSSVIHLDGWTAAEMLVLRDYGLHLTVPSLPVDPSELAHDDHDHAHTRRERGITCCMGGAAAAEGIDFDALRSTPEEEARKKRREDNKKALRELEDFLARAKHYAKVRELAAADPATRFETDLVLEAMIPYVRGEKPVILSANTYKQILDSIDFAEKHRLKCVISGGNEAWKLAATLAEKNIPVILGSPYGYPASAFEPWDSVYRCAGVLDRAGVRIAFASDSSSDAYNLGTEVGMAVAHGLTPERALHALTLGAAEILGIGDRVGSLDVGKRADLIVATAPPIQTVSQVTHMFIDGRPVELTSIHTESYEKFKNRPAPKLPAAREDLKGPKSLSRR